MEEEQAQTQSVTRRELVTLCLAVMTVATVTLSLWSCGDDLSFPGNIPATATSKATATSEPTETPIPNA